MPLGTGANLNGTASDDPTGLRFDRPYRASPTGLAYVIIKKTIHIHARLFCPKKQRFCPFGRRHCKNSRVVFGTDA
eukprot:6179905-Pleurochrysis_carterae.AAC.2